MKPACDGHAKLEYKQSVLFPILTRNILALLRRVPFKATNYLSREILNRSAAALSLINSRFVLASRPF